MTHSACALLTLLALLPNADPRPLNEPFRWRFGDPSDPEWVAERDARIEQIDRWWRAFEAKADDIDALFERRQRWDIVDWMADNLRVIDQRLMWEYGPGLQGGHRLVITPEVDRELRPFVDTLLDRAPDLDGWEFYAYRLPEAEVDVEQMLDARDLESLSGAMVEVTVGESHLVDLEFFAPTITGDDDGEAASAAFVCTEVLLGEKRLDTWIGAIEVDRGSGGADAVPLDGLHDRVADVIRGVKRELPSKPIAAIPAESFSWTAWQLEPEEREDYPEQLDLLVGKSMLPDVWIAAHSSWDFSSERFSRKGETFCYVKLDGLGGEDRDPVEAKAEIEDALDAELREAGVGAVIGGETGRRYSYVDLALLDVDRALALVRRVLVEMEVPERSWILFFDAIYANEWVGIYAETPSPPVSAR
ncbi:MAG: hypothetical protein AAGA20_13970 [Planctomycetota bacterium]